MHCWHFCFSSVESLSRVRLFVNPWTLARQASLSITNSRSSLRLMSIKSVVPSSHLNLCCPLLLLPPIPPSIRVFSNESTLRMRWPKYWSFSFSIIPSKEHPGLISFRMDSLDLLVAQGTLKSLLQHHSSKASILRCSAFFTVQLSHPYKTTGKTIALTREWLFREITNWKVSFQSYPEFLSRLLTATLFPLPDDWLMLNSLSFCFPLRVFILTLFMTDILARCGISDFQFPFYQYFNRASCWPLAFVVLSSPGLQWDLCAEVLNLRASHSLSFLLFSWSLPCAFGRSCLRHSLLPFFWSRILDHEPSDF